MDINESDVVRLILSYLKDHRYVGTLRCLEKESGMTECALSGDATFLRSLVLDGRWDDVIQFVQPLETLELFPTRNIRFEIEKQRFLEFLSIRPEYEAQREEFDVENILNVLSCIEKSCPSREEYAALCFLLTLPKLSDHPQYRKWDHMGARMDLFDELYGLVKNFFPNDRDNTSVRPPKNRLLSLICEGFVYEKCQRLVKGMSDLDEQQKVSLLPGSILMSGTDTQHIDMSILHWVCRLNQSQLREVNSGILEIIDEKRIDRLETASNDLTVRSLCGLERRPGSARSWNSRHQLDERAWSSMHGGGNGKEMWRTHAGMVGSNSDLRPPTPRQQRSLFHRPLTADGIRSDFSDPVTEMDHIVNGCLGTDHLTGSPPLTPPESHGNANFAVDTSTPKDSRESVTLSKAIPSPVHPAQEDTKERLIELDNIKHSHPAVTLEDQLPGAIRMPRQQNRKRNELIESMRHSVNSHWSQRIPQSLYGTGPSFKPVASVDDVQAVRSISFSPRGDFFAVGSNSRTLRICSSRVLQASRDVTNSPVVLFKRNRYHRGSIYCMAWSPRDDIIATGSNDKTVKLMRFDRAHCTQLDAETTLSLHDGTVRDIAFVWKTSSLLLLSGGAGSCNIQVTDCSGTPEGISCLIGHTDHVTSLYPWGDHMVSSGSVDQYVRLWDLRNSQCVLVLGNGSIDSSRAIQSVCVSDDSCLLAAALENGHILLYDIKMGRTLTTIPVHASDCRSVRFAPRSHELLSASYDSTISLTNVSSLFTDCQTKLVPHCIAQHNDKVIQCRWHPDGIGFASTSADHTVKLWKRTGHGAHDKTDRFSYRVP